MSQGRRIGEVSSTPPQGALMEDAREGLDTELEILKWAYRLAGEKDRVIQTQIALREAMRNVCAELVALRREVEQLKEMFDARTNTAV